MTGPVVFAADLDLALAMADIADGLLCSSIPGWVDVKPDGSVVTSVDFAIERALRDVLAEQRPADLVLAEELGADESQGTDTSPARRWTIDPLDHTAAFVRGAPEFATVIALLVDEEPVVGVVTAPAMRPAMVGGSRSLGAFRDDGPISVSEVDVLAEAAVSVGHFHEWQDRGLLGGALALSRAARYSYGLGGFLGHMRVAEGCLDVAVEPRGQLWDIAASRVIVAEAGGSLSDAFGTEWLTAGSSLATNSRLHADTLGLLLGRGEP